MNIKKVVGIIALGLALLGGTAGTAWAIREYRAPLGPALDVAAPALEALDQQIPAPAVQDTAQADVCGETGAWNVLVLGSDAAEMREPKGSDLTRMLHVDFANRKVAVYAFPRQLWVDTAGLGLTNPTIDATQLGTVFYEARSRSTSTNVPTSMLEATQMTARMLSKNFLVSTDHYLAVDLSQVPAMVDTVGGLPINIPVETTDPFIGMVIRAGPQTLNGLQFISYARAIPDSDFGRIQRNNLLIAALREKLLDPAVWGNVPNLYAQFKDAMVTDLSPEQINHLSCLVKEIPAEAVVQAHVKQEWTSRGPQAGSLLWDKDSVLNQLKELGLIP